MTYTDADSIRQESLEGDAHLACNGMCWMVSGSGSIERVDVIDLRTAC